MAKGLDFDCKQDFSFCEPCAKGKSLPVSTVQRKRTNQPFELIHVMCVEEWNTISGGGECFVTFLDDLSVCVGLYSKK